MGSAMPTCTAGRTALVDIPHALEYLIMWELGVLLRVLGRFPLEPSRPFARLLNSATKPIDAIDYPGSCLGGAVLSPSADDGVDRWLPNPHYAVCCRCSRLAFRTSGRAIRRADHTSGPKTRNSHDQSTQCCAARCCSVRRGRRAHPAHR